MEHYSSTDMSFNTQDSESDPVRSPGYGNFPKERTIYIGIFLYCIVNYLIRIFTSPVLTLDEANFALLGQSFQLGYGADHPPLLTWIITSVGLVIEPNLIVISTIKYVLMGLGLTAFYKATLTVFDWMDETGLIYRRLDLAAAATGAWALVFTFGWSGHEDKLPQILDFALLSAMLLCLTNALTNKGYLRWCLLGCIIGISALSHLHLLIFPFCLICAAMGMKSLTRPHYDANGDRLSPPAITWIHVGLTLAFALLLVTPHAMWLIQAGGPASTLSIADIGFGPDVTLTTQEGLKGFLIDRGISFRSYFIDATAFIMPLGLIFLMLFWPMWFGYVYPFFPRRYVDEGPFERTWRRLFSHTTRLTILFTSLAVLLTGNGLETQWMLPVFFVFTIWLFFQVQRSGPYFISMRAFAVIAILAMIFVPIARIVVWSENIMSCSEKGCYSYLPVPEFSKNLTLEGFAKGTIVGNETHLTGNLRTKFPDSRFVDANYPLAAFPKAEGRGSCLALWRDEAKMPEQLANYLSNEIGIQNVDPSPQGAIRKSLINSREKHSVLYYRFMRPNKNCK